MTMDTAADPALILVDKPSGWTSRKAGAIVSKAIGIRKVGHLGTLDPFATGLLPLCVGRGTRLSHFLDQSVKGYRAELVLGLETDSADCDGAVVREAPVPSFDVESLRVLAAEFVGQIEQIPPVYSAVKIDGQRAYKRARRGEAIEMPPRTVRIDRFDVEVLDDRRLLLEVECGPGTYIRSLGADLAKRLGTVGHLDQLRRTLVGGLTVDQAAHPEALSTESVWSTGRLLATLGRRLQLETAEVAHVRHGKPLEALGSLSSLSVGRYAVFSDDEPIALIEASPTGLSILRGLPPQP
jgi:tRNA pseudouridine55 synthase